MTPETKFVSLIVPLYNEENRLGKSLPPVFEYCRKSPWQWEILCVDDGSSDRTCEELRKLQASFASMRIIRQKENRGKGYAVRHGLQEACGEYLLFSDADFSTPIEEVSKLMQSIAEGYDLAIGSRGLQDSNVEVRQAWLRDTTGKMGNWIIRTMLPLEFADTQCGFKMMTRKAAGLIVPRMSIDGFAFDIEMLTIALVRGLRVAEVPVTWKNVEESKVRAIHTLRVLSDVFAIRYCLAMSGYT